MLRFNIPCQRQGVRPLKRAHIGLEMLEPRVVLSTFHVNSLLDTTAVSKKTGKDASGHITLRSALQAANASPLADVIILPAGTIDLTILGTGENNAAKGISTSSAA
jgi:hypothetical protein